MSEKNRKVVLDVALALAEEEDRSDLSHDQVKELNRRWNTYKTGKARLYTVEDVKQEAYKRIKKTKK
ncbi:MAG: addiction module protein [Bacteroidia bacterium]